MESREQVGVVVSSRIGTFLKPVASGGLFRCQLSGSRLKVCCLG